MTDVQKRADVENGSERNPADREKMKIVVFAGTTEGRLLAERLASSGMEVTACVATEYGEKLMPEQPCLTVHSGRMDAREMETFLQEKMPHVVVDATHPYAQVVSGTVKQVCEKLDMESVRLLRASGDCFPKDERIHFVENAKEAAQLAERMSGNIFLTTGSKELAVFVETITDFSRLYARVLSTPETFEICQRLGFEGRQLICMQGPFSEELNRAMYAQVDAKILITKESGDIGGFTDKVQAALEEDMQCIVIRRPQEQGLTYGQVCEKLGVPVSERLYPDSCGQNDPQVSNEMETAHGREGLRTLVSVQNRSERNRVDRENMIQECENPIVEDDFHRFSHRNCEGTEQLRTLTLVGIGMGTPEQMTQEAYCALEKSQVIFGAKRMLQAVSGFSVQKVCEYRKEQIMAYLGEHPQIKRAAVVFSGDVGFYSGADAFGAQFDCSGKRWQVKRIPGISSVNYFAAKLGMAWQDMKLCSVHGRDTDLVAEISRNEKVFSLLNGGEQIAELAKRLSLCGMEDIRLSVGYDLGYDTEEIWQGKVREFLEHPVRKGICVALFENERACAGAATETGHACTNRVADDPSAHHSLCQTTGNLPDAAFLRGKVPLSKEEIRAVALSKLLLTADAVCYDIGAGTGGMTMDMARFLPKGKVYAFEQKAEACELLRKNAQKFHCENVQIIQGCAPEILADYEPPTHAFIGGSSGRLREIVELLLKKNPYVRIVIDAITLETVGEANELIKTLPVKDVDIASVSVAKAKTAGAYHLMESMNPVYIFSFSGAGCDGAM